MLGWLGRRPYCLVGRRRSHNSIKPRILTLQRRCCGVCHWYSIKFHWTYFYLTVLYNMFVGIRHTTNKIVSLLRLEEKKSPASTLSRQPLAVLLPLEVRLRLPCVRISPIVIAGIGVADKNVCPPQWSPSCTDVFK